jgi:hypothetical protein
MPLKQLLLAFLFAAAFAVGRAEATTVLPLSLDDIVATSAVAFEGTCIENRTAHDAATNLVVTYTSFAVHDVIKGTPGSTYTIKQVGGELPDEAVAFKVRGVPSFAVGADYVVFLPPPSSAGFSSPVGLTQGRFSVHQAPDGVKAANGRDFREMTANIPGEELPAGLAAGLKHGAQPVRDLDVDEFKRLARQRAHKPR